MTEVEEPECFYFHYRRTPDARFDRAYFLDRHLPLATDLWTPHGLVSCTAFFPEDGNAELMAICECRFRNADSAVRAVEAPETARLVEDVRNYTNVEPVRVGLRRL